MGFSFILLLLTAVLPLKHHYTNCEAYVYPFFTDHREISMGVTDNTWHHVCVMWEIREEQVEVFKDGERKYVSTGIQSSSQHIGIEGTMKKKSHIKV